MKKVFHQLTLILFSIIFFSCSVIPDQSNQVISFNNSTYPIKPLNSNAKNNTISQKSTSPYLYYEFSDSLIKDLQIEEKSITSISLEITLLINSQNSNQNDVLAWCFLYNQDFDSNNNLAQVIEKRPMMYFTQNFDTPGQKRVKLSYALNTEQIKQVRGIAIYSEFPVQFESASFISSYLGWLFSNNEVSFGCGIEGGSFNSSLQFNQNTTLDFSDANKLKWGTYNPDIILNFSAIEYDKSWINNQPRVWVNIEDNEVGIYRSHLINTATLNTVQFSRHFRTAKLTENREMVQGIQLKVSKQAKSSANPLHKIVPITMDPGLIYDFEQSWWRTKDFEVFSWELFPSILIFDFASLERQDVYLKRLAFYMEKANYVGHLVSDRELSKHHGFNAYDFSCDTLASFFTEVSRTSFPLNTEEENLFKLCIENNLIIPDSSNSKYVSYKPGIGAIVSFSHESEQYQRFTFITHESFHGIYFLDSEFRSFSDKIYDRVDSVSKNFLQGYFNLTPTLNYNINDDFLMRNEFMAYMLQQKTNSVENYYSKNIAERKTIKENLPQTSSHIRMTNASAYVKASTELSNYVNQKYGLEAGRVALIYRETED